MSLKISDKHVWSRESLYGHGGGRERAHFLKYIDYLSDQNGYVLDVGCGQGIVVGELIQRRVKAVGIDIMPSPWRKLPAAVADGTALPFPDNTFSAAGCFAVLEHLPDPEKLLEEMARVIMPGGKIIIGCPNMRGVLMLRPGHFVTHRGGIIQRIRNLGVYLKTLLRSHFQKKPISFEIVKPQDIDKAPQNASDYNAICATNFITIKHFLKSSGFKIVYISAGMEYPKKKIKQILMDIIDNIPILREMFGGLFIVAVKK